MDAQVELAIAAPALGELRFGVARMPDGKRRSALSEAIDQFVVDDLDGLVLAFDAACAVHDAVLATRNVRDFIEVGIELVDPWDPRGSGLAQ